LAEIYIGTNWIDKDEKAIGLTEVNEKAPNSNKSHRYQKIHVVRDDREAEYRKDLGSTKNFKGVDSLIIPSIMEHTVGELQEMADQFRSEKSPFDKKELARVNKYRG